MKKMDPDSRAYRRAEIQEALTYCPPISPCPHCGYPKLHGYVCGRCDDRPNAEKPARRTAP